MKKVLCNIIVLCFCCPSFAYDYRKPLIQSASADTSEYYAFLSINANYMNYADYQLLKLNNDIINDKISNLYLKAKQFYYQKKYYKSQKVFQELAGLRNKYQLNAHSKKLVLNSIMKLYEFSSTKIEQKKYFKLLTSTYPYIDFDDLVIIESISEKLDEAPMLFNNWEIPQEFHKFNYLVINGKKHDIFPGKNIKLPKGEFILSLFSNTFYPIHKLISKKEIDSWAPNTVWINSGICDNPSLKVNKLYKNTFIFYKNDCVIENDNQKRVQQTSNDIKHSKTNINNLKPVNDYSTVSYKAKKDYKWLKNKWLWIGLGAVTTAAIISSNQNKGKSTNRTKKGF